MGGAVSGYTEKTEKHLWWSAPSFPTTTTNTSITNMAEYLAAEVIEEHGLATPLVWIDHYPEHEGEIGEFSLIVFSSWELKETLMDGVWRLRVGKPRWSHLNPTEVEKITGALRPAPRALGVRGGGCGL